jgi:predicted DNA-binding protein
MTMPVELPDEMARRVKAVAEARGVRPEQVVMEAVQAEIGSDDLGAPDNMFSSVRDELRQMAFDGTLRSEIDSAVDDPDLAVG